MPFEGGPYVKAAAFCDRVIEGKDGVLSLIRVIDRLTTTAAGADTPKDMPPANFPVSAVVMLISGRARGRHELRVDREAPDGTRKPVWSGSLLLEGDYKGNNVVLNLSETFELEGTYWYDIFVEEELLTRMPFQVTYVRLSAG